MPPLSPIFESLSHPSCNDVSSSHSTFSVNGITKKPLSPPVPSSSSTSTRRVSFLPEARVIRTVNRNEYTKEEYRACWYNKEEYKAMKTERKSTIKKMERDGELHLIDDDEYYYRGLESKTRDGSRRKQFNVVDASMSVFEEQMQQETDGVVDPETISQLYISCTRQCISAAYERGLADQRSAAFQEESSTESQQQQQRQPRRLSCHAA